jgi:hypothetical protein
MLCQGHHPVFRATSALALGGLLGVDLILLVKILAV